MRPVHVPMAIRVLCVLCTVLGCAQATLAQCGPSISARFGGEVSAVAQVNSSVLIAAHGTVAELYNIANPAAPAPFAQPRRVGLDAPAVKISMTPGSPRTFVLLANGDVQMLTVSYTPFVSIAFPATIHTNHAVDILADGQKVYVAYMYEDLSDFENPYISSRISCYDLTTGSPSLVSTIYPLTDNYGFDRLARVGNVIWGGFHEVNSSIFGVAGYDITNPSSPVRTGAALNNVPLGTDTYVTAMTAIGTNLLVSYKHDYHSPYDNEWMSAVTVGSPAFPAWQPPVNLNGEARCMSSIGTRLRISIRGAGIGTWETSNPAALTWLGAYFDSFPEVTQILSTSALSATDYWAGGRAGLMTVDETNVASPALRTSPLTPLPTGPSVVRQKGNTTVELDYTLNTMRLFDYTLPEAQQLRSSYFLPLYSEFIELGELNGGAITLACVASQFNPNGDTITILDITNPAAPVARSTITGVSTSLMSVSGSRLYVFTRQCDFRIYELASPTAPQLRSSTHFGGSYYDYTCMTSWSNNAAAIGTGPYGLWMINTTNATAPLVSAIWNPVSGYRVNSMVKGPGNFMWVSASVGATPYITTDTRLETLNVSNIANPTQRFVHNSTLGAGPQGEFSALTFVQSPVAKFLVGMHGLSDLYDDGGAMDNYVSIYELPPGFLTGEAVPFPIAYVNTPQGFGNAAVSADGSHFIIAGGERAGLYQIASPIQWAPGFGIQPLPIRPCINGNASLAAFPSGNPNTVTVQWYRDNDPLTNGPTPWGSTISGATDAVLSITRVRPQDAMASQFQHHFYRCVATNSCGSTSTIWSWMDICMADFNCDGAADFFDYLDFVQALSTGASNADYNIDGVIDFFDYLDFVQAFDTGC